MNATRTKAMAALFCAVVVAQKSRKSLLKFLRILPVAPRSSPWRLESDRGVFEQRN